MLWSQSEVLAYVKDDLDLQDSDNLQKENREAPSTALFGGFQTWPSSRDDYILIAENSEILGPNPLFTIPLQQPDVDLNKLAAKILSADYQGLSLKKGVSLHHAQLLKLDISADVHAAINYFLLFDTEARGFIRPVCVAYFTNDKNKLVCLTEQIFKGLNEASKILQHNNILCSTKELKTLIEEIICSQQANSSGEVPKDKLTLQCNTNESVLQDIQDVLDVVESYKGDELIDKLIFNIIETLKKNAAYEEIRNFFCFPASSNSETPKGKDHHKHKKVMKGLYNICDSGLVLGLYHLFILYKYFRRKYENIAIPENFADLKESGGCLYFGACVKEVYWNKHGSAYQKNCALSSYKRPKAIFLGSENYFHYLDKDFEEILMNFINWEKDITESSESKHSELCSFDSSYNVKAISEHDTNSLSTNACLSLEYVKTELKENCFRHVVTLDEIWDVLDSLEVENPGIESSFLEILKLFDDTQKLLFCVLTRIPVVLISTPEEFVTAQNFVKALSVFIPRRKEESLYVDIDRQEPLRTEHLKSIAAVNICVQNHQVVENVVSYELLLSLCILNLKDYSLSAPGYTGIILSDVNQRLKMLPLEGPAFPIIVDILCDIQRNVQWWNCITSPSRDSYLASSLALAKGFSPLDIQILMNLSKLSEV